MEYLEQLKRIAHGIAAQFGPDCEIVIHDLKPGDSESTVVYIENGHVTHRKVGDGPSQAALQALKGGGGEDHLGYYTRTEDGRILKSSTVYIKDKKGKITGIFAINYDITHLMMAKQALLGLVDIKDEQGEPERIPTNVSDLLDELIENSVKLAGKPVALMTKDDKVAAVRYLNDAGAFLITKSGDRVSKYFGISKFTLYNYIDSGRDKPGGDDGAPGGEAGEDQ